MTKVEPIAKLKRGIRFACQTGCSACCRLEGGYVYLSADEASAIAAYLGVEENEFISFFTREVDRKLALMDGPDGACVFLEDDACIVYEVRPSQCRMFPFWPENFENEQSWQAVKEVCPGIGHGPLYSFEEIQTILRAQKKSDKSDRNV